MAERLSLDLERDGEAVVLRLAGELDKATAPLLEGALKAVVGERASVRVDLEGIRSIDSAGLDLLLAAQADASVNGAALEVAGLQASLRREQDAARSHEKGETGTPA